MTVAEKAGGTVLTIDIGLPLGQFMLRFSPNVTGVEASAAASGAQTMNPIKTQRFKSASDSFVER